MEADHHIKHVKGFLGFHGELEKVKVMVVQVTGRAQGLGAELASTASAKDAEGRENATADGLGGLMFSQIRGL